MEIRIHVDSRLKIDRERMNIQRQRNENGDIFITVSSLRMAAEVLAEYCGDAERDLMRAAIDLVNQSNGLAMDDCPWTQIEAFEEIIEKAGRGGELVK